MQHFITAMDSLKLNMVAVDQVSLKPVRQGHLDGFALHIERCLSRIDVTAVIFTSLSMCPEQVPPMLLCCVTDLRTDNCSLTQLYPVLNDLMQSMNKVRSMLHTDGLLVPCKN